MRGPGYKLTGDVRRTWRCPLCGCERKLQGNVTSLLCGCRDDAWMQIVSEHILVPRPLQRPSDVERSPLDFGIEPAPAAAPARPEATIIKPAISADPEIIRESIEIEVSIETVTPEPDPVEEEEEEWGEGIL